ncbi:hypothetical protein [Pontibacter roseus]|uniref:hypothetical protein n=1 Tax=Pontibacter roseus TaxID=336989 RepID=UPI00039D62E0|nr:hypothetical protein [Pontibacter roseus]
MKRLLLLSILGLATFHASVAQEVEKKPSPLKFLVGGAFEFGGDEVAEIYFTNGDAQSVKAGQGVSLALGGQLQFPKAERLLLRATLGYKYVTTQADNAHIRLTRVPLHLTANWMATDKIRLGAGLVSHQNIQFKADGIGQDVTFKGASGPIFEVAYGIAGLTYTVMEYKDQANHTYAANAIGLTISGVFPRK